MDETYVKVAGTWTYLYRAVDSAGETIEFMLSPKRDLVAAKLFLRWCYPSAGPCRGALDEHEELFRMYGDPWYYDTRLVASSKVIPMAPGAVRYYRRGISSERSCNRSRQAQSLANR